MSHRSKFTAELKAKVALEALRETSTKGELAKKYEVAPEMISRWKKGLLGIASAAFGAKSTTEDFDKERETPCTGRSKNWRWKWISASGYTKNWGYLYPRSVDIPIKKPDRKG